MTEESSERLEWVKCHDFSITRNGVKIILNAEYEFYLDEYGYPTKCTGRTRLTEKEVEQ